MSVEDLEDDHALAGWCSNGSTLSVKRKTSEIQRTADVFLVYITL
jgi:hypothetical protein